MKYFKCDKTELPHGHWMNEPDFVAWTSSGLTCIVRRNPCLGFLCGYVGVPKDHWIAKVRYNDLDISVHGGLTFGQLEGDEYFVGFDCGHVYDVVPKLVWVDNTSVYRDMNYVSDHVNSLARHISELKEPVKMTTLEKIATIKTEFPALWEIAKRTDDSDIETFQYLKAIVLQIAETDGEDDYSTSRHMKAIIEK